ncbi:MAG TPA: RAD55 family ATPase [Candidatus Thermoplasmatota archaeon]
MTEGPERVPTGVKGLDTALGGGLRVGSLAVVVGSTMSGRDVLAQQFFAHGLSRGEAAVYVTTKDFADDVFARLGELGFDRGTHKGSYKVIDAYSTQSDPTLEDRPDVTYVPSIADFAKLSNAVITTMSSFLTDGHHRQRIAFDSLDTVLMYVNAQGVFRLLSYLRAKVKAFGATSVFLLEPGLHEERDVRTLLQLADAYIELTEDAEIHVTQLGRPKVRYAYEITPRGIVVTDL